MEKLLKQKYDFFQQVQVNSTDDNIVLKKILSKYFQSDSIIKQISKTLLTTHVSKCMAQMLRSLD